MKIISELCHPVARDLAWVMVSPSLISSISNSNAEIVSDEQCLSFYRKNQQWISQLDKDPAVLAQVLSKQTSSRLGYYFEDLVAYWLSHKIADDCFESHVKVSANKRDLGEFDFLFRRSAKFYHWEAAVKFYLYTHDPSGVVSWYGPNANDTLQKKLSRMLQHQLRLSELDEAQEVLADRGIDKGNITARMFLKGYLFYPLGEGFSGVHSTVSACEISPAHLRGWWARCNELDSSALSSLSSNPLRWRLLPKREWLAPRVYDEKSGSEILLTDPQLIEALQDNFRERGKSRLIAGYSLGKRGLWQEQARGFVVNRSWPD